MWPPVGVRLFFAYCLALLAGSPAIGNLLVKNFNQLKLLLSVCQTLPKRWSALSEGLRQLFRVQKLPKSQWRRRWPNPLWLIAPFLLILASCSIIKPKLPEPTPEKRTPMFECVDTALKLCPGVVPIEVDDCGDAVKIASAALTALEQCQTYHGELIACVLDYVRQGSKTQK